MSIEFSTERRMLTDSLNRFLEQHYSIHTHTQNTRTVPGLSLKTWRQLADLGILAALFNEADGGLGGDPFDIQAIFECFGQHLVTEPFLDALIVGHILARFSSGSHQSRLEQLIAGEQFGALAHLEPGGHYELSLVNTSARKTGQGWQLDGHKTLVTQADMADFFLVSARTEGAGCSEKGIALFILARHNPGLVIEVYRKIDGGYAAEVKLEEAFVPENAMLCLSDTGFVALEYGIGYGLLALCAEAVGAMDIARNETLEYLRTRKQFNTPLGKFQALQHRMADLAIEIEQARSAVVNAASAFDKTYHVRERALSAAKYTISKTGLQVAEECIQFMGGIGMTWELPLSHYAKRLVMIGHQFGDDDHHLERYIHLGQHKDHE